ncbi:MAG: hypothetical protein Q8L36_01255 [bacterium]|nr:hypothetical protein [bacterium]
MYAKVNIEKFLNDHPEIDPAEKTAILTRTDQCAENGVFSGGAVLEIFGGNSNLADLFEGEATTGKHIEIGLKAMEESLPINPVLIGMLS